VLWDYDLGDGLGRRHCGSGSTSFVRSRAGTRDHLWDVQDDVRGTNVGDGVLFHTAVRRRWADSQVTSTGRDEAEENQTGTESNERRESRIKMQNKVVEETEDGK